MTNYIHTSFRTDFNPRSIFMHDPLYHFVEKLVRDRLNRSYQEPDIRSSARLFVAEIQKVYGQCLCCYPNGNRAVMPEEFEEMIEALAVLYYRNMRLTYFYSSTAPYVRVIVHTLVEMGLFNQAAKSTEGNDEH